MTAARCAVQKEWLLAAFHLVQESRTDIQPVLVEVLDIGQIDDPAVLAIILVGRRAVHLGVVELVLLHHFEACR